MAERHKWAKEIIAWLNGNKDVQYRPISAVSNGGWVKFMRSCSMSCFDDPNNEFRIAPKTILINGHEVPEPCREEPKYGTNYFYSCPSHPALYGNFCWRDGEYDLYTLKTGFVHLTKEAAIKHAEALKSFTQSEEK